MSWSVSPVLGESARGHIAKRLNDHRRILAFHCGLREPF
jgi:hypothetical protein